MSFYATLILALALSMDAFAVAICKGAVLHKPRFKEILRTGFIFGIIEALTPIIGWELVFSQANMLFVGIIGLLLACSSFLALV